MKYFTESPNVVGWSLLRSSSPASIEEGEPEQVAKDGVQSGFGYLHGWRLQNFSGQPAPVFEHPHN